MSLPDRARLAALAALAQMLRDRDLAALSAAARASAATRAELERLRSEVDLRSHELAGLDRADPALRADADSRWLSHLGRSRATLRLRLAREMAEREAAKARAQRALGRADVLGKMSKGQVPRR